MRLERNLYVIGYDEDLRDSIFVDIANKNYPIMTAMHGEGDWDPKVMFSSLKEFLDSLS